ncbi:MAG TPA: Fic family protein [Acidimicrobiales bacterium]|nr:Fic family protein [Acidimicrobiales bacterium]
MSDLGYLTLEDTFDFIEVLRIGPIRDLGLLDSALARPRSSAFGHDAYTTLELKASALLHSLINNHPLVDGNKRLAWLSTTVFLRINGLEANLDSDKAFALVLEIASGSTELEEIARRLAVQAVSTRVDH